MGADYIEQDVVLTKDDIPIVRHDIHLDATTNVAVVFPEHRRPDGRFYAVGSGGAVFERLKNSVLKKAEYFEGVFYLWKANALAASRFFFK